MLTPQKLSEWFESIPQEQIGQKHHLSVFEENNQITISELSTICDTVRNHYVDDGIVARRMHELGAPMTAQLIQEELPKTKRARSGDLGEILATEFTEKILGWNVPIKRLRWKDGREMALRGDDLIALEIVDGILTKILKGESKSRTSLDTQTLEEATEALHRDSGRPTRHSVIFISKRLHDSGFSDIALEIDKAVAESFKNQEIEHLLFTLSGNNPSNLLRVNYRNHIRKRTKRNVVGLWSSQHQNLVALIFENI